jgi:hypothetical protein
MNSDLLSQAEARMSSAQSELDQALLAGQDTTQAREYLASTQAEVKRIEATLEAETARIAAETSKDLESRAAELVEAAKAELLAEFEAAGITDVPEFDLPVAVAVSYLRASDQAADEMTVENSYRQESHRLQVKIGELNDRMLALVDRRRSGEENQSDPAMYLMLSADRDGLKDMQSRLVRPQVGRAVEWVEDARKQWRGELGRVRAQLLQQMAPEADERVLRLARLMSTTRHGVSPTRYFPSLAMQKALSGRVF